MLFHEDYSVFKTGLQRPGTHKRKDVFEVESYVRWIYKHLLQAVKLLPHFFVTGVLEAFPSTFAPQKPAAVASCAEGCTSKAPASSAIVLQEDNKNQGH